MTVGLLATAFFFGLRHGVDWDHIAAIADLSGTAGDRRRGFRLSFLYAVGHALVVFALGCLAIVAGSAIPDGLDRWMGRVVGLTLIWLGIWVLVELARHGRDFRLRSRWMLVLDGSFAGLRRVARMADRRVIEVEHDHEHEHVDESSGSTDHDAVARHHDHGHASQLSGPPGDDQTGSVAAPSGSLRARLARRTRHAHRHRHVVPLPDRLADRNEAASEPTTAAIEGSATGPAAAVGIGMLHGVGVESPTQIAVFVASTSVVGWAAGLAILAMWCVGLVAANAALSLLAGFGLLEARRNFVLYASVAVAVAIGSIVMGTFYLFGLDVLPAISG